MAASPSSQSRLSRLVLLSAGGLLILGLLTLGMALRNAEAFAREEARGRATDTLEALRANLARPSVLELIPAEARFEIQEGKLLLTDDTAAREMGQDGPDTKARAQTLRARMDGVEKQRGIAGVFEDIDRELQASATEGITNLLLITEGAWRAEKGLEAGGSGFADKRRSYLDAYERERTALQNADSDAGSGARVPLSADRSIFVLRARAGLTAPSWSGELLSRLQPGPREALVERAEDLASDTFARSFFVDAMARADRIWARRSLLQIVRTRAGSLLGRQNAWSSVIDDRILLWFPATGPVTAGKEAGKGALVAQDLLLTRLREVTSQRQLAARADLLPMTWSGTLVRQDDSPEAGLAVWTNLWLVPMSATAAGLGGQPWFLGLLFILVFVLLIVGLWQILDSMKRERASMALRSEFLTSVTHELKTPLSSIRLFTEMLAEGRVSSEEKRHEYHRLLAGEAGRLSALVENVLDLGRMERGERSYDPREEDLVDLVGEAVDLFRPIAEAEGMQLGFDHVSGKSVQVEVDRTALMQALLNLFENARKYASQGGLLQLRLEERDGEACLVIQDRGPGIPVGERESIFERFRRGKDQSSGSVPGVGLGLYLARRILRTHGGEIEAIDPPPGSNGACLLLRLPLATNPQSSPTSP